MKKCLVYVLFTFSVIAANAQYAVKNCNPCKLETLVKAWKKDHRVIASPNKLKRLGEPVYMDRAYASFEEMVTDVFSKQTKLGCYFLKPGECIIKEKERKASQEAVTRDCRTVNLWLVDPNNQPVAGATIEYNGKPIYATDDRGYVLLDWCRGDSIHISHVNFKDSTILWQNLPDITIRLKARIQDRDPANVNGYLEKDLIKKTATVSVVRPEYPVNTNVVEAVRFMPGMLLSSISGVPGATNDLKLRGNNFINNATSWQYRQGNEPLVIIDGIPQPSFSRPLNQFRSMLGDPKTAPGPYAPGLSLLYTLSVFDIAEIKVLKDAEATAIYGARGANGVIAIRTKKAVSAAPEWNAYIAAGSGSALGNMNDLMNTPQYLAMRRDAYKTDNLTPTRDNAPDLLVWDSTRNVNYKKWLLNGKAGYQDAQVGYSGAKHSIRYLLSGSYHKETTVLAGDVWAKRGSLTGDLSYATPTNRFQTGLTGYITGTENNWTIDNPMNAILSAPNLPLLFKNDGSYNWQGDSAWFLNPWSYFLKRLKINTTNLLLHAFANYRLLPGLHAELSMGYNGINTRETSSIPIKAQVPQGNPPGSYSQGNNRFNTLQAEGQLNYNYTRHQWTLNAMIAGSLLNQVNTTSAISSTGYTDDNLLGVWDAAGDSTHTSEKIIYRFQSRFARVSVDYKDRYILSLTGRQDFSSRFGENNRGAQFYSVGAGWIIYKEKEDSVNKKRYLINFAKLRGSWGTTGNDNIGDYKYLNTYSGNTATSYQGMPVVNSNGLANPYYQWEKNKKLELAFETSWFGKKFLLDLIYYRNRSSNLLLDELQPSQTGFGVLRTNFPAVIQNSGLEVEAETRLSGRHFNWSSKLTLAIPRNKLVSFPNLENSAYRNSLFIGESVNAKKVYEYTGVNDSAGLYTFKDTTNKVTQNYEPAFFGGLLETVTLGRFQLTTGIEFRVSKGISAQAYLYNYLRPGKTNRSWQTNQLATLADHWTTPGKGAPWQRPGTLNNTETDKAVTSWLNSTAQQANTSFIRWKFASIRYLFSDSLIRKFGFKKAAVFFNMENIATITSYKGADPEILNPLSLPPSRILTIGFQITF